MPKYFLVCLLLILSSSVLKLSLAEEQCNSLDTLIDNRVRERLEVCTRDVSCIVVNCTTVVDRDQDRNPRLTAIYTVTFDPCAEPNRTVEYQNINVMAGSTPVTVVNVTTSQNVSQPIDEDTSLILVVTQTDDGIIFGVSQNYI